MTAQKDTSAPGQPGEVVDYYRLLQVDPDAPLELIVEAYWYVAGKLQTEQAVRKDAERELEVLNAAYATLTVPERRHAYDATVPRVAELPRARAELKEAARQQRPLLSRLLGKAPARPQRLDCYALLFVDPAADPPLIARAYSVLRTLHSRGDVVERLVDRSLAELEEAYSTLIDGERRAAYDGSLVPTRQPEEMTEQEATAPVVAQTPPPPPAEAPAMEQLPEQGEDIGAKALPIGTAGKAILNAGRFVGRCALAAGASLYRGARWTGIRGGRACVTLAGKTRHLAEQWSESRSRQRPEIPDDRLDQRLRHEAIPPPLRKSRPEPEVAPCRARLLVTRASGNGNVVDLGERPVTLGSDRTCEVVLEAEEGAVAAAHAQIWPAGGRFIIRSLSERHPTSVGGREVNWAVLDDGDEIEIGRCRIRFEAVDLVGQPPDYLKVQQDSD